MKKIIRNNILGFIIGGVLFGSIGVYAAYKYQAEEVGYTPNDTSWKVDNVESAISDLYLKTKGPGLFSEDSWETIIKAVRTGNTSTYRVGDTKEIDMGDFGTHTVRIANMSTPSECSGSGFSQTACGFVIEFVDGITNHRMNATDTNVGGWPASEMRTYVNNDIYNSLPNDLKLGITTTYVVSRNAQNNDTYFSNDKIFLFDSCELSSNDNCTQILITRVLDYYIGKSTSDVQEGRGNKVWWLRPSHELRGTLTFMNIFAGRINNNQLPSSEFLVVPAFRIG